MRSAQICVIDAMLALPHMLLLILICFTVGGGMRGVILAVAAYLVSTILLVNGLLKAYSGRPRPVDATLFGGDLGFVPAGDFSGACMANCSFVSGEAAAAGWLLPSRRPARRSPAKQAP